MLGRKISVGSVSDPAFNRSGCLSMTSVKRDVGTSKSIEIGTPAQARGYGRTNASMARGPAFLLAWTAGEASRAVDAPGKAESAIVTSSSQSDSLSSPAILVVLVSVILMTGTVSSSEKTLRSSPFQFSPHLCVFSGLYVQIV